MASVTGTTVPPHVPPRPADRDARAPRASLWVLRITAVLHLAILALQPLLAGMYLDGDADAIGVHGINAHIVQVLCFTQFVVAICYAWPGGGRIWPMVFSFALWWAEGLQLGMGYARVLIVHILLGVGIVAAQALFTVWTFRPAARSPRALRASRKGRAK